MARAKEYRPCPLSTCQQPAVVVARIRYHDDRDEDVIEHVYCAACREVRELRPVCSRRPTLHLGGFVVGRVACRLCRYRGVLTHAYGPGMANLRCPSCRRHALDLVAWDEA